MNLPPPPVARELPVPIDGNADVPALDGDRHEERLVQVFRGPLVSAGSRSSAGWLIVTAEEKNVRPKNGWNQ